MHTQKRSYGRIVQPVSRADEPQFSPLLLSSVPAPQPAVHHKLNVTELVNLIPPADFQRGRKGRKRRGKEEERPCHQLQLRSAS